MDPTRLEDAEALCMLWDESSSIAVNARRVAATATRLHHRLRSFASGVMVQEPEDPRLLLGEIGAVLENLDELIASGAALKEAAESLRFAFVPHPDPHPALQEKATDALLTRLRSPGRRLYPIEETPGEGRVVQVKELE